MLRIFSLVAVIGLLVAACGGDSSTSTSGATATTDADQTTEAITDQEAVTVHIIADEYSFESDLTTFEVGVPYHFVVENVGEKEHEFMIIVPMESGVMDMEAMDDLALVVIEEDDLEAGAEATADYIFTADDVGQDLEFACHIDTHYEDGMHLPITVTS